MNAGARYKVRPLSRSKEHIKGINLCYRNPRGSGSSRQPKNQASFAKLLTQLTIYVRKPIIRKRFMTKQAFGREGPK